MNPSKRLTGLCLCVTLATLLITGCASAPAGPTPQERKTECLIRHNTAKLTCDQLFKGEPNGLALQRKLIQCVAQRGFPQGMATCDALVN